MAFKERLSIEKEQYYIEKLQQGDKTARNILIEHNLRFVVHVVKKFKSTDSDIEELMGAGTIGLIKGIDSYKTNYNTKLATYISRCIKNEILMYLRKEKREIPKCKQISLNTTVINNEEHYCVDEFIGDKYNLEENYIEKDYVEMIKYTLTMLPENERKILIYYIFYKKTQTEISQLLNMQQVTVSRTLKRIYKKIKPYFDTQKLSDSEIEKLVIAKRKYLNKKF